MRWYRLAAAWVDRHLGTGDARRLAQKRRFARIRLDELDAGNAEDRHYETGKPGTAAEIYQTSRRIGHETAKLSRIEEVPPPQIGQRVAPHVVLPRALPSP